MADHVWYARWNDESYFFVDHMEGIEPPGPRDLENPAFSRYRCGEPVSPAEIVQAGYFTLPRRPDNPLSPVFRLKSYIVVSPALRAVLETADLGASIFTPLPIFKTDRQTPFAEGYSILHIRETKAAVIAERSKGLRRNREGHVSGFDTTVTSYIDLAIAPEAQAGPELWLDSGMGFSWAMGYRGVFFSQALGERLRSSGIRRLLLQPARIDPQPAGSAG